MTVRKVSDRTFLIHLGGKLEVMPKVPLKHRDDLSRAYTPGVARVCLAIADEPRRRAAADHQAEHRRGRHRRVGGARAGQHRAGGRDAGDGGQGRAVQAVRRRRRVAGLPGHPGHRRDRPDRAGRSPRSTAAINLEDISAPALLRDRARGCGTLLDIPVFHDDQHGTAIVVLAALTNALRVVGKKLGRRPDRGVRRRRGRQRDHPPAARPGRQRHRRLRPERRRRTRTRGNRRVPPVDRREHQPRRAHRHAARGARRRRRLHRRLGAEPAHRRRHRHHGARRDRVRAGQPRPRGRPGRGRPSTAAVVATGRSDYPNQINNVLAFPGFFRGLLDAGAHIITDECLLAAATAIADCVAPGRAQRQLHRARACSTRQVATARRRGGPRGRARPEQHSEALDVPGPPDPPADRPPRPDIDRRRPWNSSPNCTSGSLRGATNCWRCGRCAETRFDAPRRWTSCLTPPRSATATGRWRPRPADLRRSTGRDHRAHRAQDDDQRPELRRQGVARRPRGREHPALGATSSAAQVNLYDAIRGTHRVHLARTGKHYTLRTDGRSPTIVVRPRGWHLDERHIAARRRPAVGALVDFGLYFFHNAAELLEPRQRPVLLPAQDGEPPRGPAVERRLHLRRERSSASRTARSAPPC